MNSQPCFKPIKRHISKTKQIQLRNCKATHQYKRGMLRAKAIHEQDAKKRMLSISHLLDVTNVDKKRLADKKGLLLAAFAGGGVVLEKSRVHGAPLERRLKQRVELVLGAHGRLLQQLHQAAADARLHLEGHGGDGRLGAAEDGVQRRRWATLRRRAARAVDVAVGWREGLLFQVALVQLEKALVVVEKLLACATIGQARKQVRLRRSWHRAVVGQQ